MHIIRVQTPVNAPNRITITKNTALNIPIAIKFFVVKPFLSMSFTFYSQSILKLALANIIIMIKIIKYSSIRIQKPFQKGH